MYFNCVTFFVWMPKLNFKSWTYYNIDKISQWEQSHYKSQFEFSYYCAFPRFLFGFDRKNLLKCWKLVWIGLLKWLNPMWGFNQIYNPIFNYLSKDIYRTVFKKHQYDAVLLLSVYWGMSSLIFNEINASFPQLNCHQIMPFDFCKYLKFRQQFDAVHQAFCNTSNNQITVHCSVKISFVFKLRKSGLSSRSVNPISTKGGRLYPPNNTGTPGFSDLPTALKMMCWSHYN